MLQRGAVGAEGACGSMSVLKPNRNAMRNAGRSAFTARYANCAGACRSNVQGVRAGCGWSKAQSQHAILFWGLGLSHGAHRWEPPKSISTIRHYEPSEPA